jgi:hypothetical protein
LATLAELAKALTKTGRPAGAGVYGEERET